MASAVPDTQTFWTRLRRQTRFFLLGPPKRRKTQRRRSQMVLADTLYLPGILFPREK